MLDFGVSNRVDSTAVDVASSARVDWKLARNRRHERSKVAYSPCHRDVISFAAVKNWEDTDDVEGDFAAGHSLPDLGPTQLGKVSAAPLLPVNTDVIREQERPDLVFSVGSQSEKPARDASDLQCLPGEEAADSDPCTSFTLVKREEILMRV
ncbi:hypothetical protein P3T76_006238 [Phytophthora citrophthora]|uniref:Uncharacterized protein n=1 Tax=Phytophthora citrophthora TaxID=4793 RepID=A0AAD9GQI0_9STRA|nr:hypothetical protein P3T76_006238 [Phytophthora citrophthora]